MESDAVANFGATPTFRYIYLGIVTTSLILVMNTLVLCETEVRLLAPPTSS